MKFIAIYLTVFISASLCQNNQPTKAQLNQWTKTTVGYINKFQGKPELLKTDIKAAIKASKSNGLIFKRETVEKFCAAVCDRIVKNKLISCNEFTTLVEQEMCINDKMDKTDQPSKDLCSSFGITI